MSEKLKLRCITKDRRPSSQQVNRWIRFVIDSKDCSPNAQTQFNEFCRVYDECYRQKEYLSNDEESQPKKKKRKLNESLPLADLIIARHFGRAPEDGPFIEVAFFEKNDNTITEVKLCPNHGCPCKNDFQIKVVSMPERDAHGSPGKTTGRDPPTPTDLQHATSFLHIALQLNCTVRCFGKKKGTDYALLVGINLHHSDRSCLITESIALLSSSQSTRLNMDGAQTSPNQKVERENDDSSDASDNPRTQSQELDEPEIALAVVKRTKEQDQDLAILMLPEGWKCFIEGKTKKALNISQYVFEIFSDYFSSPSLDSASIVPFKTNAKLRYFYDHQLVFALILKSYLFFKIGRSTDAINAFKVSSFPTIFDPNETSFADYLFMLATIYTITGDWTRMRQSAKHGLFVVQNLSQAHGENQQVSNARLLAALGAGCAYQRSFTEALKYLHDSIQVIRTTTTPFSKGLEMFSLCMMTYCYGLVGNFNLALHALNEAIQNDTQHFSEPKADLLLVQSRLWAYQGKAQIAKNFVTETLALFDYEANRDQFYNVYISAGANNLVAVLRAILYILSQPSNADLQFSNEIRQELFTDLNTVAILSLTNQEHGGLIYALMYDIQIVCERNRVNELLVLQMMRDVTSEFPKTNGYAAALNVRYEILASGNHYSNNNHNGELLETKPNLNL